MELVAIVGSSCGTRLCHAHPLLPAHTWLMQRCRPQNGRRLLVNVARLASSSFSLFFVIPPVLPRSPFPFPSFFYFCFIFSRFFFLLCFAAALFLARVPFCAYAILVYLLAILLAMNLFVFIVKPAAELPQNTNKQRPTSTATLSAPPDGALKGCRLARTERTELLVGCVCLFCSQMNVIYIFNNESDSHRTRFRLPLPACHRPRLCLKHLNLNIFSML